MTARLGWRTALILLSDSQAEARRSTIALIPLITICHPFMELFPSPIVS